MAGHIATDASALYARNLLAFTALLIKDGAIAPDLEDEILAQSLIAKDGRLVERGA